MKNPIFTDPELNSEIEKNAKIKTVKKDSVLIKPGDEILYIPIVLKGALRVIRQDDDEQEVFLYHLFPGQTCAMSLSCCQAGNKSMIRAVAEDDTKLLQIPVKLTEEWYRFKEWKEFISQNYHARFTELLEVIDLIAFSNMDKQLLSYLRKRARALNTNKLEITHKEIADELHAHREAVSRLLREMEKKKLVRLGRNRIELLAQEKR